MGIKFSGLRNAVCQVRPAPMEETPPAAVEFHPFVSSPVSISVPVNSSGMTYVSLGQYGAPDFYSWPNIRFEITGVPLEYFYQGGDQLMLYPENTQVTYVATMKVFSGDIESPTYDLIVSRY